MSSESGVFVEDLRVGVPDGVFSTIFIWMCAETCWPYPGEFLANFVGQLPDQALGLVCVRLSGSCCPISLTVVGISSVVLVCVV